MEFLKAMKHEKELYVLLQNLGIWLNLSQIENALYHFLLAQVCFFKKELIHNLKWAYFSHTDFENYFLSLHCTKGSFYRAIKKLGDKNILIQCPNNSKIAFNVPGLLMLLRSSFDLYEYIPQYLELFAEHFRSLKIDFKEIIAKKENLMKLEKAMQNGVKKYKNASKRKDYRILSRHEDDYTPTTVYQLMAMFCEESGLMLYTRMTQKVRGQMKNWIKDCRLKGQDIKARLKQICTYWGYFTVLTDYDAKRLCISSVVSFEDYYKNQKYIDPWLDENQKELEEELEYYKQDRIEDRKELGEE